VVEGEVEMNTLRQIIYRRGRELDPDSRADQILGLCFRHNLIAVKDKEGGRVFVGTLTRYLGIVGVNEDWEHIENKIVSMSMEEMWD
jgi:hypothetical protein